MLYAINQDGNAVAATKKAREVCGCCGETLIAKCGSRVVWHWAHESNSDCDPWSEGETPWHAAWKSRFDDVEVVMRRGGDLHRADAVGVHRGEKTVIEFQHSTITADDVFEREQFYGGGMIWVLDATQIALDGRVRWYPKNHSSPGGIRDGRRHGQQWVKFRWLHRKRSFDDSARRIFLDMGRCFDCLGGQGFRHGGIVSAGGLDPQTRQMMPQVFGPWWDGKTMCMREPGVYQHAESFDGLLEIRKMSQGYGWGVFVSHREFCEMFGANMAVFCDRGRQVPVVKVGSHPDQSACIYGDGRYSVADLSRKWRVSATEEEKNVPLKIEQSYAESPYCWCAPQIEKRAAVIGVNAVHGRKEDGIRV